MIYDNDKDQFALSGEGMHVVFELNEGPCAHDLSARVNLWKRTRSSSPRLKSTGPIEPSNCMSQFKFGASIQSEHQTNPTNNMEEQTMCSVYLDSVDGPQGGHWVVLNFTTGQPVTGKKLHEIPLTKVVRTRVEALAKKDGVSKTLNINISHAGVMKPLQDSIITLFAASRGHR